MRIRRVAGVLILIITIGAPIVEAFDQWDDTLRDGNDTEANLVVVALCVGLALSIVGTVGAWMCFVSLLSRMRPSRSHRLAFSRIISAPPIPTSSPPRPLRI